MVDVAVGANGMPVNVGDAILAFKLSADVTNAVVAICVVLVPAVAVVDKGTPVKLGEFITVLVGLSVIVFNVATVFPEYDGPATQFINPISV